MSSSCCHGDGSGARLSACEQASKLGSGDDRHAAVLRCLEIFVAGDEIVGWRRRGHEIEEWSIPLITQCGAGGVRIDKLCCGSNRGQKAREIDACSGKGWLELGTTDDDFEFCECGRTHDWDEAALQHRLDNPCGRPRGGQQARHENIRIKNDAHGCAAPPRPRRRSGRG